MSRCGHDETAACAAGKTRTNGPRSAPASAAARYRRLGLGWWSRIHRVAHPNAAATLSARGREAAQDLGVGRARAPAANSIPGRAQPSLLRALIRMTQDGRLGPFVTPQTFELADASGTLASGQREYDDDPPSSVTSTER